MIKGVYKGRPEESRSEQENAIYDALDRLEIGYLRADHSPADTMEACRAVEEVLDGEIAKNLFLCNRQQTEFYLLLMPADKPFKTKYLSAQAGCTRLSFAGAEHMAELLHTVPGSVSPLELIFDRSGRIRLLIDRELLGRTYFAGHPGFSTSTLKLKTEDLLRYVHSCGHEVLAVDLPRVFD